MRLWSIHFKYLDSKGLVALWREALLAKKVLEGKTKGYKNHPQLERFRNSSNPISSINSYLEKIFEEAQKRNYKFDKSKIKNQRKKSTLKVTQGQLIYEFSHLKKKLKMRNKNKLKEVSSIKIPKENSFFKRINGNKESWEKN